MLSLDFQRCWLVSFTSCYIIICWSKAPVDPGGFSDCFLVLKNEHVADEHLQGGILWSLKHLSKNHSFWVNTCWGWRSHGALVFVFTGGKRWTGPWTTPTNQTWTPSRCLWGRFHGRGQRSSCENCLNRTEPSTRLMSSETEARIHHRAKVLLQHTIMSAFSTSCCPHCSSVALTTACNVSRLWHRYSRYMVS